MPTFTVVNVHPRVLRAGNLVNTHLWLINVQWKLVLLSRSLLHNGHQQTWHCMHLACSAAVTQFRMCSLINNNKCSIILFYPLCSHCRVYAYTYVVILNIFSTLILNTCTRGVIVILHVCITVCVCACACTCMSAFACACACMCVCVCVCHRTDC